MTTSDKSVNPCFISPLASWMNEYIQINRTIGHKYNLDAIYLKQFDTYCDLHKIVKPILSQEIFDGWCSKRPHETERSHHIRVRTLRRFSMFLHNNNVEAPTAFHRLPNPGSAFIPYIFTREEISCFLTAAKKVKSNGHNPVAGDVFPLLFQTLYCCGLRLSEALNLRNDDVDLSGGILTILNAKHGKDRLVPMSESLRLLFLDYSKNPSVKKLRSEFFFPAPDSGQYASCSVYTRFRRILWDAGISHGGRGAGPRLHDLRHSFAVHALDNWVLDGKDIYVVLPILSIYMGHKNIYATQRYLRLTPEAYPLMLSDFESQFGTVFPSWPSGLEACNE